MTRPLRRTVMSPQTRAALGLPDSNPASSPRRVADLAGSGGPPPAGQPTGLGVDLRAQRRLAIRTMVILLAGMLVLPPVLLVLSDANIRLAGIPLTWLVLGVASYPALLLLADRHRRSVDALERALARRHRRSEH